MQATVLAAAKNYERDAIDRIRRVGILSAELEVKGKRGGNVPFQPADGMTLAGRYGQGEGGSVEFTDSMVPQ